MRIHNTHRSKYFCRCSGYEGGQAALVSIFFTLSVLLAIIVGFSSLSLSEARAVRTAIASAQSYYTAEAGHEDVVYRIKTARSVDGTETIHLSGTTATTTVATVGSDKDIFSSGEDRNHIRRVRSLLTVSSAVQFFFGIQAGEGGIFLENLATIAGNVYSNGPVTGQNNNVTKGSIVSAGASGLIDGIHATSSAYAHTIRNSDIDGDAYFQVLSNTDVGGVQYPGSPDQATSTLPIPDSLIEEWKAVAAAGGVIGSPCPYVVTNSTSLGPKKINCDLIIQSTPTITLEGPVWVNGDIIIQNSPVIRIAPSLGASSVAIIADNSSDRINSSTIALQNSTVFEGSGFPGSYILFVSQNRSAEALGQNVAIDVKNSASGDVLVYAGHGKITIQNNIDVREVTAYRIHAKNSAEVIYETGLTSLLFSSGPGGGYSHVNWREVE